MKVKLSSQEVNLILLALDAHKHLPICKDLVVKLSTQKPTVALTYGHWLQQGRQVIKGSKSIGRDEKGVALFAIAQTKVISYSSNPADVDYDDMFLWDTNY